MRVLELTELLDGYDGITCSNVQSTGVSIAGLTSDSRQVRPGYLFAALPGTRTDGRAFIDDAVARGAVAVLIAGEASDGGAGDLPQSVPILFSASPRRDLALLAARFFDRQPNTVAAVTGTNGKTSVVWFLRQLWAYAGYKAASLGTLGIQGACIDEPGALTTPDPVRLHADLRRLAESGIQCLAMEASSHGLDQNRLDGVCIAAAAFTNLTRDHLDYHTTMAAYLAAKRRLFTELLAEDGVAVVNVDDEAGREIAMATAARNVKVLTFGEGGDIRLETVTPVADGQQLEIDIDGVLHHVFLPLVGDFQAANALCAFALGLSTGVDLGSALGGLERLEPAPGRLQKVARSPSGASIYVDYAHTPDALENALKALRPSCAGRLSVVFGCGGDRDPGKRLEMGRIAATGADRVYVTDDNPRTEDPTEIRAAILTGCPNALEIGDRAEAIGEAIGGLQSNDLLLVAGKGHERGQIIGDEVFPFDDAGVVREIVGAGDSQ